MTPLGSTDTLSLRMLPLGMVALTGKSGICPTGTTAGGTVTTSAAPFLSVHSTVQFRARSTVLNDVLRAVPLKVTVLPLLLGVPKATMNGRTVTLAFETLASNGDPTVL